MNQGKIILLLSVLLGCSTLLAVYGFMSKGNAVPAVTLVVKDNEAYAYEKESGYNNTRFWNNYPYWVMLSEGRALDSFTQVIIAGNQDRLLANMVKKGPALFLKIELSQVENVLADTTFQLIKASGTPVFILTDATSVGLLAGNKNNGIPADHIGTLPAPLNLPIEKARLPYFFLLTENLKVSNIFVPRTEIPEVTTKYLAIMHMAIRH